MIKDLSSRYFLMLLPVLLCTIIATGCVPKAGINFWPVPAGYKPYLPPDEKEDVLLICIYDYENKKGLKAGDAQILSYPYDKARLGTTGYLGLVSVAWKIGIGRDRHAILLFTKESQLIYIPLWQHEANDYALSYFYVMDNPPLGNDDFYSYGDNGSALVFNCLSPGYYYYKIHTAPDVKYLWISLEDARLARKFWEGRNASQPTSSGSTWKLHSIFGAFDEVLLSRPVPKTHPKEQ